jgi:hypothetical protein
MDALVRHRRLAGHEKSPSRVCSGPIREYNRYRHWRSCRADSPCADQANFFDTGAPHQLLHGLFVFG